MDAAVIDPRDYTSLETKAGVTVQRARNATGLQVAINAAKPYLSDARVRQAFQYAIDRQAIIDTVFAKLGSTADTYIFGPKEFQSTRHGTFTFDPQKARDLLKDAKWDSSQVLKAYTNAGVKVREDTLLAIQGYLADVGVTIQVLPSEADVLNKVAWPKPDDPNGMDFYLGGTYLGEPDPDLFWEPGYKCGLSEANYCNESLDAPVP